MTITDSEIALQGLVTASPLPPGLILVPASNAESGAAVLASTGDSEAATAADFPDDLDDLTLTDSHTYDLSVTRAGQLNIPVVGSGSGDWSRRVVVWEFKKYREIPANDGKTNHYGYVVRFAVTVNKWETEGGIDLPFLTAKAQLGQITATWRMQVRGLTGPQIDTHIMPPRQLDVETFVLGKQALEGIIASVHDESTVFTPELIATLSPPRPEEEYWLDAVRTFAVDALRRGWNETRALGELDSIQESANDEVRNVFRAFGASGMERVPDDVRRRAGGILRNLSVRS